MPNGFELALISINVRITRRKNFVLMVSILSDKHTQHIHIRCFNKLGLKKVKNQCGRNSSSGGQGTRKFTNI